MSKFFKNKKIFITGHTGFKGIWLVSILNYLGAMIYGYSINDKFKKSKYVNYIKTRKTH